MNSIVMIKIVSMTSKYGLLQFTQDYLDALEAARNDSAKTAKLVSEETIGLHNDE